MEEEVNYFWLNCGYTRWNHNEPLVGQTTLFESGAQFNPTQVLEPSKRLRQGSSYILSSPNRYWITWYWRNY